MAWSCCRRDLTEQEVWRRSWGSHNKDEFWAALQSDYDYLMDNNLIDTCKVGALSLLCQHYVGAATRLNLMLSDKYQKFISCDFSQQEASGDLSECNHTASSDGEWSFNQFTAHFLELYSWLNSIQEAVYGKEETVTDRGLRTVIHA